MKYLILLLFLLIPTILNSQINIDIVNKYLTHGKNTGGNSIHLQCSLYFNKDNIEFGLWNSYGLNNKYLEIDPYIKFNFNKLTIQLTDVYNPINIYGKHNTININPLYLGENTSHQLEFISTYNYNDFTYLLDTYLFGNDKINNKQLYSTYLEIQYFKNKNICYIGFIPSKNILGNHAGIVNIGIKHDEQMFEEIDYNPMNNTLNICIGFHIK